MALRDFQNVPGDFQTQQKYSISFGYSQSPEGQPLLETRVVNENNDTEQRFCGLAAEQALAWIQQQTRARFLAAGLPVSDLPSQTHSVGMNVADRDVKTNFNDDIDFLTGEDDLATAEELELHEQTQKNLDMEFVDLALEEVPVEAVANSGVQSTASRTLRASGRLRVYADDNEEQRPYRVEFMLVNLDTAHSRMAAVDQGTIQPQELAREISRDFPIPARGHYQVNAVVRSAPNSDIMAESRGPVLRVVE